MLISADQQYDDPQAENGVIYCDFSFLNQYYLDYVYGKGHDWALVGKTKHNHFTGYLVILIIYKIASMSASFPY